MQAVQQLVKEHFKKVTILNFPVEVLKGKNPQDLTKINKTDLVIIGGGGIYYHWFMPFDTATIKKIKPPITIFGVGYIRELGARKLNSQEIESIAYLNQQAKLISVRDYYSKSFLAKAGVAKNKIQVIGDPAIFLEEKKPSNLKMNKRIKIGLNLNYSGWLGFGRYQKEILNSYTETAKYFQKQHQAEIYYLMHHPDEKRIYNKLGLKFNKIIDYSATEQKYIYGQLDLIVGMMLHSVVMAFGAGTPFVNVAYDLRNKSFGKFINCPELIISCKNLKKGVLKARAKKIFSQQKKYEQKFKRKKGNIKKKQDQFLLNTKKLV